MPVPGVITLDYLEAYDNLSRSRASLAQPLSIADIKAYFEASGMFDDFSEFLYVVQIADTAFIKGRNK